ncbi:MAG: hypothetical protein ABJC63_11115 [Gemmatimonadales bacterium]
MNLRRRISLVAVVATLGAGCHRNAAERDLTPPPTLAMVGKGDTLFHTRGCFKCHGNDAKGERTGPILHQAHFYM